MTALVFVPDTNVLMDMRKPRDARDVSEEELSAAKLILRGLLESDGLAVGYSTAMLAEWSDKGLLREDRIVRTLLDRNQLRKLTPRKLSGGNRAELGTHVDHDDQSFILAAAAIPDQKTKPCVTRDPKTIRRESRRYVKGQFGVVVLLASEFAAECL